MAGTEVHRWAWTTHTVWSTRCSANSGNCISCAFCSAELKLFWWGAAIRLKKWFVWWWLATDVAPGALLLLGELNRFLLNSEKHLPDVGWGEHVEGNHRWEIQHSRGGGKWTVSSPMSTTALESYVIACKAVEFSSADASLKPSQFALSHWSLLHCCLFHVCLWLKTDKLTIGHIS